ncbi:enolase C-terminal domain-like protein [Reyranella sp. CPCC 100927]|uniref:enolase C-terminal domain-like protein n=1 Tax=Reyranella sp. CPCC 100927 TaxID=2599616 RepID=UPI0011B39CF0|nr:enolase C-terminal domain-like protein [Reyranella sp. CPCC 100927]TWT15888.1 mandelate racemase [Reyranella sp. CPCC 100927]
MKITDVTLTLFAWDSIPATTYGSHTGQFGGSSQLGLLRLITDQGLEGHAFLGSAMNPATTDGQGLITHLKPVLLGRDPLDRERLNQDIWRRQRAAGVRPIGAVDVALWDLAGKAIGQPIHRLLGTYRESIPAYASSAVLAAPEAYAEEAVRHRDAGWAAYKIHPPTRWREDIKVCEAVRKAVGDDYTVMLDSTWSYDFPAAVRVGLVAQDLGFHWYEDPLADQDIYNYVKLKQKLSIPILATEYPIAGYESYAPWIMLQATDFLRGDVAVKGGITTLVKAAHLAEAFRMNFEVHHGGNSLNNVANLHVIAAIRNTEFFEVLLPDGAQKYGLQQDIVIGRDGLVHVPNGPGLGAAIDFDLIKRKTVTVLS